MDIRSDVLSYLKVNNFNPSKKMGQNFLIDQNVINNIFNNLPDLTKYDLILEIGPGLGAITNQLLLLNKAVIAIELDKRLFFYLKKKYVGKDKFQIINDDFLKTDLNNLLNSYKNIIVIANIPYSITAPIIIKCTKDMRIKCLYLMVQKEVAQKLNNKNSKDKNSFTTLINYYWDLNKNFEISSKCFIPSPNVDSSMLTFIRKKDLVYDEGFALFLKTFFLNKRKKVLNNVENKNKLLKIFKENNIDENIRAEQISNQQLYDIYIKLKYEKN